MSSLSRDPLPRPTRVTVGAIVVAALAFASELLWLGPDLSVSVVVGCLLVAALVAASGRRWTTGLGALVLVVITVNNPFLVVNLSGQHGVGFVLSTAVSVLCAVTALVAGAAATVTDRHRARPPRVTT